MAANRSLTHGLVYHLLAMYMDDEGRIVGLEGGGAAGISLGVFLRSCCCCYLCITHLNELQLTFCTDRLGALF